MIGGTVSVPAAFGNQQKTVALYIRPVAWGVWTLYELSDEERKDLPGGTHSLTRSLGQQEGQPLQ